MKFTPFTDSPISTILASQSSSLGLAQSDSFLLKLVDQTGFLFYPLAALSFLALALIIFYCLTIRQGTVVSSRFLRNARQLILNDDYQDLLTLSSRRQEAIARITESTMSFAMNNPQADLDQVKEVAEAEGNRQAGILHQRISYLADIGSIAPMVGLLGTVLGMIQAFGEIATEGGIGVKQMELASGVSQALLTTAGGLIVGIPALIAYALFRGKVSRLISEMESATTHLLAMIGSRYNANTSKSKNSQPQSVSADQPESTRRAVTRRPSELPPNPSVPSKRDRSPK